MTDKDREELRLFLSQLLEAVDIDYDRKLKIPEGRIDETIDAIEKAGWVKKESIEIDFMAVLKLLECYPYDLTLILPLARAIHKLNPIKIKEAIK